MARFRARGFTSLCVLVLSSKTWGYEQDLSGRVAVKV